MNSEEPDWDYYRVLGISREATYPEIKKAYHKLAKEHHPDMKPQDVVSEKKFKEVSAAYGVLSDVTARATYDAKYVFAGRKEHTPLKTGHPDVRTVYGRYAKAYTGKSSKAAEEYKKSQEYRYSSGGDTTKSREAASRWGMKYQVDKEKPSFGASQTNYYRSFARNYRLHKADSNFGSKFVFGTLALITLSLFIIQR